MEKKKQESEHGDFGLIRVPCNKLMLILNKTENTRVNSLRFVWIMEKNNLQHPNGKLTVVVYQLAGDDEDDEQAEEAEAEAELFFS